MENYDFTDAIAATEREGLKMTTEVPNHWHIAGKGWRFTCGLFTNPPEKVDWDLCAETAKKRLEA